MAIHFNALQVRARVD